MYHITLIGVRFCRHGIARIIAVVRWWTPSSSRHEDSPTLHTRQAVTENPTLRTFMMYDSALGTDQCYTAAWLALWRFVAPMQPTVPTIQMSFVHACQIAGM